MATSRTGTTKWKAVTAAAKKAAQANGQTQCPYCQVTLNYHAGGQPNSAEGDHITPHAKGGEDRLSNCQVICRRCNISKSDRTAPRQRTIMAAKPLRTSRQW